MRWMMRSCFENGVRHKINPWTQRLETLDSLSSSTCTGTGASGAGTGTCATATAPSAQASSTGGRLRRGIGHVGHAAGKVIDVANHPLREGLHAAHDGGGKVRAGEGSAPGTRGLARSRDASARHRNGSCPVGWVVATPPVGDKNRTLEDTA